MINIKNTHKLYIRKPRKHNRLTNKIQKGGDLDCSKKLGSGFSSQVFLCEKDGTKYAGKFAWETRIKDLENELDIYRLLYKEKDEISPNIVKYYDIEKDEKINLPEGYLGRINLGMAMLLELCKYDLYTLILMHINRKQPISIQPDPLYLSWLEEKPQTIFVADTNADWYIAKNIFNGLYYLFKQKVVHFDIKMENIFVCNVNNYDIVKIGDFGFAKHIKQIEEPDIQRGTRKFIPKNNNCYHTHFFRDLYAFMGVVFTLAELTTFNKDQDGEPLEVLFLNEDYLKLNNEFYIILNILVMFEKEITDAKLGDYLKTTVDILNIYEAVYNEINAFFDKPKLTDGLKFETKQAKNKLLIPPKLPLVIPTLNTSKKTKGAYNNKFPSGYDAYGA